MQLVVTYVSECPSECPLFIVHSFPLAILLDVVQTMFLLIEDTVNDTVPGELEFCLNTVQQLQREATVRVFTTQDGTAESETYCHCLVEYIEKDITITIIIERELEIYG